MKKFIRLLLGVIAISIAAVANQTAFVCAALCNLLIKTTCQKVNGIITQQGC